MSANISLFSAFYRHQVVVDYNKTTKNSGQFTLTYILVRKRNRRCTKQKRDKKNNQRYSTRNLEQP